MKKVTFNEEVTIISDRKKQKKKKKKEKKKIKSDIIKSKNIVKGKFWKKFEKFCRYFFFCLFFYYLYKYKHKFKICI